MQNKTLSIDYFDHAEADTIRTRTIAFFRAVPKLALLLLALGYVAVTNAAYLTDSKQYPVVEASVTWRDNARGRDVPVSIYAPDPVAVKGKLPAVLFSPGFGESRDSYAYLGRYLARNGYITVVVDHIGSDTDAYKAMGWAAMADTAGYQQRPEDISFAIDRITASDQHSPLLHNRVDASRIGVAGHSLGSTTALSMVGLSVNLSGRSNVKYNDSRVAAAVALSPQVDSPGGFKRKGLLDSESWDGIDKPVLLMTGSLDYGISRATRSDPGSRHVVFDRLSGVDAYYMNIENAAHHAFTDTKPFYPGGPRDPRHHVWIGVAVTAFFDAYLRNDTDALAWLQNGGISKYTNGEVHQEQKIGGREPGASAADHATDAVSSYDFEPLTAFIDNGLRERGVTGAGMLIIDRSGHVFYEKMFGDWTEDKAVPIASASKWWAAATVMTLVDQGLIGLDDPVSKYLPEFRNKGSKSKITLRQTLSFTSGYSHHERIQDDPSITQAQLVRDIADMDLQREPGTAFIYGGMQMEIAGRVAEVVTGKPYRQVFEEQILRPLGANATRIGNMVNRRPTNMDFKSENPLVPGGVVTSLTDYRKFILMLLNGGVYNGKRILSSEAVGEMMRDQTNGVPIVRTVQEDHSYRYSLGAWYRVVDAATGEAIVSSGGAFGTSPWIDLKGEYGVVFITMARAGQLREFVWRLKDTITDIMDEKTIAVSFPQPAAAPHEHKLDTTGVDNFFRRLDKNDDQQLERDEIPGRMKRLSQAFDRLDRDHDGRLSVEEFDVVAGFAGGRSMRGKDSTAERTTLAARDASMSSTGLAVLADDIYSAVNSGLAIAVKEQLVLHDERRDKDVQMRITYPRSGGPYPLIIFSHYSGGTKDDYVPLVNYWVSRGYVCIQPDHSDSPEVGGKRGPEARRDWKNRPLDISFIIDSLHEISRRIPELQGRIDEAHIGVGGHYLGAYTTNLIGGMEQESAAGGTEELKDARVSAIVALSPQGTGQGLTAESWRSLTLPMFVMTGSGDYSSRTGNSPQWRTEPYQYSPSGDKYLVFVEGLTADYGGIVDRKGKYDTRSSSVDARLGYTEVSTTAFWDAYLKGSEPARQFLRSGELETASGGAIKLSWK
jgi:predicted dienelactone hydrolase/CubicO group peptidase (beta-lactamase class C family)